MRKRAGSSRLCFSLKIQKKAENWIEINCKGSDGFYDEYEEGMCDLKEQEKWLGYDEEKSGFMEPEDLYCKTYEEEQMRSFFKKRKKIHHIENTWREKQKIPKGTLEWRNSDKE